MSQDGTFKTLDEIRECLPFGDDIFHLAVYKSINENLLTEEEKNTIDLNISRLKDAFKTKLNNTNLHYDNIATERLVKE
jgi:hypothetical protein